MSNSNATVNSPLIAQTALTTLLAKFPILSPLPRTSRPRA